jgi:hypothetical protein
MIVSANAARRKPSEHIFVPGAGYVSVGPIKPRLPQKSVWGTFPRDLCDPPPGVKNQSWHAFKPPHGAQPITFQWLSEPREWFRLNTSGNAHRLGFSPAYLSSHGWRYLGAARGRHG